MTWLMGLAIIAGVYLLTREQPLKPGTPAGLGEKLTAARKLPAEHKAQVVGVGEPQRVVTMAPAPAQRYFDPDEMRRKQPAKIREIDLAPISTFPPCPEVLINKDAALQYNKRNEIAIKQAPALETQVAKKTPEGQIVM